MVARLVMLTLTLPLVAACEPGGGGGGGGGLPSPGGGAGGGGGACVADCAFKKCGDDGCGGTCGSCDAGLVCIKWQCVPPGTDPDAIVTPDGATGDGGVGPLPDVPHPTEGDSDGDNVADEADNCPAVFNPNQGDLDEDFLGDACDPDIDGDGYINDLDCEPLDVNIHPGAYEWCDNARDDDCDNETDEEGARDCIEYFVDADNDGAGPSDDMRCLCAPEPPHVVLIAGDCDDADPATSPLAAERCDDADNNCNLLVDEGCDDDGDGFCDADLEVVPGASVCPAGGGDCYDYSAAIYPGAPEVEGDGLDNDCDGVKAGEPTGTAVDCTCTNACIGGSVQDFLCAMDMCCDDMVLALNAHSPTNDTITGAYGAVAHYGDPTNDLVPFQGASYAVLGSGLYANMYHEQGDTLPGGALLGVVDPYTSEVLSMMNDAVEVHMTLQAPEGATGFSVDYIFMSAEYEEFIGTEFNDKFYIVLEATSTNAGQPTVINYTQCTDPGQWHDVVIEGQPMCYIAINTGFTECCDLAAPFGACDNAYQYPAGFPAPTATTDISGTGHQCPTGSSTGWLVTKWPIVAGESFELTFHIHDTADQILDSTVLIDNFQWEGGTFQKGTASHN